MKGRLFAIGLLLLAFAACTSRTKIAEHGRGIEGPSPTLSAIDSLMWRQPDSAFAVLQQFAASPMADSLDVFNGHYCQLLISELLYKNDWGQSNRPALQQAVAYFDSLLLADARGASAQNATPIIAFLDARAHYINGVGYYEQDSAVQTCQEYLMALEIMEEGFGEEELVEEKAMFMALTHTHLAQLFSDKYLHEQAISFGKEALNYYQKYDATSWHVAWMLNGIGTHFDMMKCFDSAEYYYKAASVEVGNTNSLMYRDIAAHSAYLKYETGDKIDAVTELHRLLSMAESERELLARSLCIGEIFYHERQFDSARIYLDMVFHGSTLVDSRKQAAEWLVEICKTQDKEEEIIGYAEFLVPFANINENQGVPKSQLTTLCQDYERKRQENLHQQKARQNQRTANRTIGFLFGVMAVVALFYILSKKQQKQLKLRQKEIENKLETERYSYKINQETISGRLKKSNEALRLQKEETEQLLKALETQHRQIEWNHLDDFMNEDICKNILEALDGKIIKREAKSNAHPELRLNEAQLQDLSAAVEKHFCGFEKTLSNIYPRISRNAMNQCMLYLLNLEDVQIAALLSCDYSTVKKRSTKLKNAFRTEKEPRQFIREIVL